MCATSFCSMLANCLLLPATTAPAADAWGACHVRHPCRCVVQSMQKCEMRIAPEDQGTTLAIQRVSEAHLRVNGQKGFPVQRRAPGCTAISA